MLFSNSVPEVVLESPNTSAFLSVLDKLQEYKSLLIADALRSNNYAVVNDRKWILKHLSDFGVTNLPMDMPLAIIQQVLLNVDTLFRTRGSKIGIELFCSLFSLGEVEVDDSKVYVDPVNIILDSTIQGYIVGAKEDKRFYLVEDNDLLNPKTSIKVTIRSKYFDGTYQKEAEAIKRYIKDNMKYWLGFSNTEQDITFEADNKFHYHKLLNKYFV